MLDNHVMEPDMSESRRRATATMIHEFMNFNVNLGETKVGTSRSAIKADLADKIAYDKPAVFERLGVFDIDETFVSACAAFLKEHKKNEIALLKNVAEQALGKMLDILEGEEVADKANGKGKEVKSGNHGTAEEKEMYNPLLQLFTYISNFDKASRPPCRTFQNTNIMLKPDEPHTLGFPSARPDITIIPCEVTASKSKKWRDRHAFGEVKPSKKQGVKPIVAGTMTPIVTQSADYARLFMSARPFMLFCVGILIFGTEFCVGIFDRNGITFSPIHDMFQETEMFVRVVSRLACDLTIQDLGCDPTVHVLSDEETKRLTGKDEYPSAVVLPISHDLRQWCTIGPPIWTSLSLLGRGTRVWLVCEYIPGNSEKLSSLRGDQMIMKTAWRNSRRTPESKIYLSITQPIPGLAKFECGGDVLFPGLTGYPITVGNLRSDLRDRKFLRDYEDPSLETPILHRLILSTVGRPMWDYTTDLDLLTGFRDALQAHKRLCDQQILHRDISAGNVMLSKDNTALCRGFITDLDFAHIQDDTIQQPDVILQTSVSRQSRSLLMTRRHEIFEVAVTVKRNARITGTTQFMSRALLLQADRGVKKFVHRENDDVESFIWVLSYCVMRNLYHRASYSDALKDIGTPKEVQALLKDFRSLFREAFGQVNIMKLVDARQSGSIALRFPTSGTSKKISAGFMSEALIYLFEDLQDLLNTAHNIRNPTLLTHDSLLTKVNEAIAKLEATIMSPLQTVPSNSQSD